MTDKQIDQIFDELISVYTNLKAEVALSEIMEHMEVSVDDFIIANKSTFKRPYRRDIMKVDTISYDDFIVLNLSRNGLYDQLPEGLFHSSSGKGDYATRRKRSQSEEQEARSFFAPIENEFFAQRIEIEQDEREFLNTFYRLNDEFLSNFWKIDSPLPKKYFLKLVKSLPYCYKITGNLELTRLFLENIFDDKIKILKTFRNDVFISNDSEKETTNILGVDTVLADNNQHMPTPHLEVVIGPVKHEKLENYLKKDGILNFINTFYDYLIPMEFDVTTTVTVSPRTEFKLDEKRQPVMGISTII